MSYRLRRKTRPQADVEIYGGPLQQKRFDGGMNIDSPASEIKGNQVAYAENVIFREFGMESRPGYVQYSQLNSAGFGTTVYAYTYNPASYTGTYQNFRHTINKGGEIWMYKDNPCPGTEERVAGNLVGIFPSGNWNAGTGDTTMIPYRRGWLVFTSSKISYVDPLGAFQVNAPNPVHGFQDSNSSGTFKYRYLITLSRILVYDTDPTNVSIADNRLSAGAEVVHESGSNGKRYYDTGTSLSTERDRDYAEIFTSVAIDSSNPKTIPNADLIAAFGSIASPGLSSGAAGHFTHVSIYRTTDYGTAGQALGNNKAIYVWVGDVKREDVDTGITFSDTTSDEVLGNYMASQNLILKTQGFTPMPSGSCAEVAGGWMFVSDRSNATPENYLHYCALSSPENFGYYFADIQKYRYNDGIRAMRANQDILSVFCNNSSHIVNLTAVNNDASKTQYIPFLTYFHTVDRAIGIRDWGTLDSIDENSMIAVCSDGSVRVWDTTKWGEDLAFERVSSEIKKIVPASPYNYAQGSVGKFYNGAYYLWYSKDTADTKPTKCLRYGFGKQAGYGWCFYTGWVYPHFKCGAQVIIDNLGVQRLIVMSGSGWYWAETFRPYTGAMDQYTSVGGAQFAQLDRFEKDGGTYLSGGAEIACTWKYRELIGSSEEDILVHDETFLRWRPLQESVGYRAGFTVALSAYKNGSETAFETVTVQPRSHSIKFTQEVSARRVQLGVSVPCGAWRNVGIDSHFRSLDKINFATAGDNSSSESTTSYPQYQAELASNLALWLTRREIGLDRATGVQMTPASSGRPTTATGPDSKSDSAYYFNGTATVRDYTEAWSSSNAYWAYDGDQDFATYPGFLAAKNTASGTSPVFQGGTTFSMPITNLASYPLKQRHRLRCLSNNSVNTALCLFDVSAKNDFSEDFVEFIVGYDNGSGNYYVEAIGSKSGVPFDEFHDTGIARVADLELLVDIDVGATGWSFRLPQYSYVLSDSGWAFSGVELIDVNVQRTNANNQGMLKDSRIWTEQGGTSDARYDETEALSFPDDFSASFWVKGYAYDRDILRVDGSDPLYFQLLDSTHIDVCGMGVVEISAVGTGWNHFFIRRGEGSISVFQNGVLKGSVASAAAFGGGNAHVGLSNGSGYLADVRLYSTFRSTDANTYYYNNVIALQGDMVMPQV